MFEMKMFMFCAYLSILLFLNEMSAITVLPGIGSNGWAVQNSNGSINVSATVPGGIYSDLRNAGILPEDVLYRFNDVKYRWVANESWIYSVIFNVDQSFLTMPHKELVFNGVDTYSYISLNGVQIGKTNNMFVRYRFDVQNILKETNTLDVKFLSTVKIAEQLSHNSSHVVPPKCVPKNYKGECHVNFLRKMQASFSWDWGPAFPSVGIWKSVQLIGYERDMLIRDITVTTVSQEDTWNLTAVVYLDTALEFHETVNGILNITLNLDEDNMADKISSSVPFMAGNTREKSVVCSLIIPKNRIKLWWPNGFGDQPLYNLTASFHAHDKYGTKTVMIGFRTVELIEELVNHNNQSEGLTFYFKINGVPIFAKGSNWIPSNILPEKSAEEETIRPLLKAAKLSNMNMLRVWGGGLYESDLFYQLCDKYGIMIWQDMMFACNMYPVDEEFLATVSTEIEQQIRSLQFHPCIVLWAGNNENEAALRGNWYNTKKNFSLYKEEYIKLYVHTVRPIVLKNDNSRSFLVSSPTNGIKSEHDGYIAKNPYDPLYGDIHYYNYWRNSWSPRSYPYTRFASEYGLQSLPSFETLQHVSLASDLNWLGTKFMLHRQHLAFGYVFMALQNIFHFAVPSLSDLKYFIYLTQINQAWGVKSQTEWYRRNRNTLLSNGKGLTMGALYWQLNDVWQAPSWSSIEHGGKWKMLQYYVTKMFAPVLISPSISSEGDIEVTLISDLTYDIETVTVIINIFRWDSLKPVTSIQYHRTLKRESALVVLNINFNELYTTAPYCGSMLNLQKKCFIEFQLLNSKDEAISPDNYILPSRLTNLVKYSAVPVTITVDKKSDQSLYHNVTVTTNSIALFVWLETESIKGYFSDNGFIQTISQKIISFTSQIPITSDALQSRITVTTFRA